MDEGLIVGGRGPCEEKRNKRNKAIKACLSVKILDVIPESIL